MRRRNRGDAIFSRQLQMPRVDWTVISFSAVSDRISPCDSTCSGPLAETSLIPSCCASSEITAGIQRTALCRGDVDLSRALQIQPVTAVQEGCFRRDCGNPLRGRHQQCRLFNRWRLWSVRLMGRCLG